MEKKEPINVNVSTFLLIIAMIIIGVMAYFMYSQKIQSDKEIANLQDEAKSSKATINELQGKVAVATETNITEKSSKETSTSTSNENQFSTYQSNFEKTYKSVMGSTVDGEYEADQFVGTNFDRNIRVDRDGNAYYGENKKIDTNVASAHYCNTGQDGGDIVLIHRDGTVSIIEGFGFPDTKVEAKKMNNVKNIVNVISVVESGVDDIDGGWTYYLVDINGNIIDVK